MKAILRSHSAMCTRRHKIVYSVSSISLIKFKFSVPLGALTTTLHERSTQDKSSNIPEVGYGGPWRRHQSTRNWNRCLVTSLFRNQPQVPSLRIQARGLTIVSVFYCSVPSEFLIFQSSDTLLVLVFLTPEIDAIGLSHDYWKQFPPLLLVHCSPWIFSGLLLIFS